jgi:hypothetical protein
MTNSVPAATYINVVCFLLIGRVLVAPHRAPSWPAGSCRSPFVARVQPLSAVIVPTNDLARTNLAGTSGVDPRTGKDQGSVVVSVVPCEELAAVPFVIFGSASAVVHDESLVERVFED